VSTEEREREREREREGEMAREIISELQDPLSGKYKHHLH
jgi:hypothetical protein